MAKVALFVTCVADVVQPDVAVATVRVLRGAGHEVEVPKGQTCCGQPAWNSGFVDEAAAVAATTLDALEASSATRVVVPAGSCTTMMRLYWPELFRKAGEAGRAARAEALGERIVELTELLAGDALTPTGAGRDCRAVYHRSCHMERELHLHDQPTDVLATVPGCELRPWEADDRCCGFGGTFSVRLPETAVAMADAKLDTLPEGTDTIIGADSSCLLHLQARADQRGLPVRTRHVAEVLAEVLDADG